MITIAGCDLETTGLLDPEHRIIECHVSLYDYAPDTFTATHIGAQTWRIDPKRSIDKKAQEVHGISPTDLIGKPIFKEVGQEIADMLNRADIVVAHNGMGFDFPFLVQEWERCDQTIPDFIPFDTMLSGRFATPMGAVPNLGALCFACGVDYNPVDAHAAEYDVTKMMGCLFFGLKRGVYTLPTE
jgi:DNA polymerase-3 subunit epsilon